MFNLRNKLHSHETYQEHLMLQSGLMILYLAYRMHIEESNPVVLYIHEKRVKVEGKLLITVLVDKLPFINCSPQAPERAEDNIWTEEG
jgi:hypothetical protein